MSEHDGARIGVLRHTLRELEPGPQIGNDGDVAAERVADGGLGIGRVRERADRVGMAWSTDAAGRKAWSSVSIDGRGACGSTRQRAR